MRARSSGRPAPSPRPANRRLRYRSTATTRDEVSDLTSTGKSSLSTSGTDAATIRAARSSATSPRTRTSTTTPAPANNCSARPRASARLHADRRAPRRLNASAVILSRSSAPGRGTNNLVPLRGTRKPSSANSRRQCASRAAPEVGTTLSGRSSAHARRSQACRSRGPGSSPWCSPRHSDSY